MDTEPLIPTTTTATEKSVPAKVTKKVSCSVKLFILLIIVVAGLLCTGYIIATILHLKNGGISEEIHQLSQQNKVLRQECEQFSQNNARLEMSIKNLTKLNLELNGDVVQFRVQNVMFQDYLSNLNATNINLNAEIENLESNQDLLEGELARFKNKTADLSKEDASLKAVEKTLRSQLADFSGLRQEVANYSREREESLDEVMQTTANLFSGVTAIGKMNHRTNLLQLAANCEFLLDSQPGFMENEYNLFLESVAGTLKTTQQQLQFQYPYNTLQKNQYNEASWKSIVGVVEQMLKSLNQNQTEAVLTILESQHIAH